MGRIKDTIKKLGGALGGGPGDQTAFHTEHMKPMPGNPNHISPAMRLGRFLVNQEFVLKVNEQNLVFISQGGSGGEGVVLGCYYPGHTYSVTARNRAAILQAQTQGLCSITAALPSEGLQLTSR